MRIALTRLRAAIAFFSPMAADSERARLKRELKWLNARLGATRDMDVAIEQLKASRKRQPGNAADYRAWKAKCADSHQHLARALASGRYRRLIADLSDWVENGAWSRRTDERVAKLRGHRIAYYSARRLTRWRKKLLKRSRGLADMDARKRHRLRLANKRLRYSIEFFAGLLGKKGSAIRTTLKQLRKAQQSLGELNDAFNGRALTAELKRDAGHRTSQLFDGKREKQLVRAASRAYRKMAELKPL